MMRIDNKQIKRGFTLTELIIVIVIIGILAAVIIPTVTHYVERARLSNDRSDARNLTMLLSLQAYDLDQNSFDPSYVIGFAEANGYSLKSRAKGYSFHYNEGNNSIQILSDTDPLIVGGSNLTNNPLNKVRQLKRIVDII